MRIQARAGLSAIVGAALGAAGPLLAGGPAGATTVREPAFGLPHFYAATDRDLAYENGREIAKDRLGQLILVARVGRGTLAQAFGALDPSALGDDIEARLTAYTSAELNDMFAKLPVAEQDLLLAWCEGVNDTIEDVYAGVLPEPVEVNLLRTLLGLGSDLFGNASNLSDQVDPFYRPPGGADPTRPNAGFQFTPELAVAIGILQVRNFGLEFFDEASRLAELQALVAKHGAGRGTEIWDDLNWLVDPLAPVTVPDPRTPGYGGPLASLAQPTLLATAAGSLPRYDYAFRMEERRRAESRRAENARRLGAWPSLGSYAWVIGGSKTASGHPWLGGFPQTGIQTPSIMHFAENRSGEGASRRIQSIGMEFVGAPLILIGQTDRVAWTSTTAQLRVMDTVLETLVGEDTDALRYDDEGTPAPLVARTEIFRGGLLPDTSRVFWRSRERGGDGGSRPIVDFVGDANGTADSGSSTSLVDTGAFDTGFAGGFVAIVGGPGAGQMRAISAVPDANTLQVAVAFTTPPGAGSRYAAARSGKPLVAVAFDSAVWREETTSVLGFAQYQRAESVLDVRAGARLVPSTHNFLAIDNRAWNGIGTQGGASGNIGYQTSGFSRVRQSGLDPRLPVDGSGPNPWVVASGTVTSATPTTLVAGAEIAPGRDLSPLPLNFRYDEPDQQGSEFIVTITGGTAARQTRRIAAKSGSQLTVESPWGVTPAAGDSFEVAEIVGMPEAINPREQYMANWNNKSATADDGSNFGRQFRHVFILERLAAENAWDAAKQRQLNEDVAGLDGKGAFGRFLVPRLRQAVDTVGNGGNPAVDSVLAALEAHMAAPAFGRDFVDPVSATLRAGENDFLEALIDELARQIYGDEYAGAVGVPGGSRALNLVQHAIDSAAGDPPGAYRQAYQGDYFAGGRLDEYLCYGVRQAGSRFRSATVQLADALESGSFEARHVMALCAPGSPDGSGLLDGETHLLAYRIRGQGRHTPALGLAAPTRFGSFSFDTRRPDLLLVPASTSRHPVVPPPAPTSDLDHYKCYQGRLTPGQPSFPRGLDTRFADSFEDRLYRIGRPRRLCLPVDKNGEGINRPELRLLCFRSAAARGETAHRRVRNLGTTDQLGSLRLDTIRELDLCVPEGRSWEALVRDVLSERATAGIPADGSRGVSSYVHPLAALFPSLVFAPTPSGNRGTWEQIVEAGPVVNGEFMFPLGQSGLIVGSLVGGITAIDPNADSLHPIWRDWRFVPMLHVSQDLPGGGSGDSDGDGVLDGFERWHFGDLSRGAGDDSDGDGATLLAEFAAGSDPNNADTDGDGIPDGADGTPQDRLLP